MSGISGSTQVWITNPSLTCSTNTSLGLGGIPTLNGLAETLAINLGSLPTGAANFQIHIIWTEE